MLEIISIIISIVAICISLIDVFKENIRVCWLWLTAKYDVLLIPIDDLAGKGIGAFQENIEKMDVSNYFTPGGLRSVRYGMEQIYGTNLSEKGLYSLDTTNTDLLLYLNRESNIYNCCKFYILTRKGRKATKKQK